MSRNMKSGPIQSIESWLVNVLGDPSSLGAASWVQVFYWVGGALIALVAVWTLRQRTRQARATYTISLYELWIQISKQWSVFGANYGNIKNRVAAKYPTLDDQAKVEKIRIESKTILDDLMKTNMNDYVMIMEILSFFETIGFLVRSRYVPLRDVYRLWKGPILDADRLASRHIAELQQKSNVHPGLLENFLYLVRRTKRRQLIRSYIPFVE